MSRWTHVASRGPTCSRSLQHVVWILTILTLIGAAAGCSERHRLNPDRAAATPEHTHTLDAAMIREGMTLHGQTRSKQSVSPRFGEDCAGFVGHTPAHTLILTTDAALRLTAQTRNGTDLVMVLSGRNAMRCSDDFIGTSPGMQLYLPKGEYNVYVGTFAADHPAVPYRLVIAKADAHAPYQGLSRTQLREELSQRDAWNPAAAAADIRRMLHTVSAQNARFQTPVPTTPPDARARARDGRVHVRHDTTGKIVEQTLDRQANAPLWPIAPACGGFVNDKHPTASLYISSSYTKGLSCSVRSTQSIGIAARDAAGQWYCEGVRIGDTTTWLQRHPRSGDLRIWAVSSRPNAPLMGTLICKTVVVDEP